MFRKKKELEDIDLVILRTASNNYELGVIQGLLEDNKIPFMLKDRESGDYMRIYCGFSIFGTDVLVDSSVLEKAKEVLDVVDWDGNSDSESENT